jgi:hypothetical protein
MNIKYERRRCVLPLLLKRSSLFKKTVENNIRTAV